MGGLLAIGAPAASMDLSRSSSMRSSSSLLARKAAGSRQSVASRMLGWKRVCLADHPDLDPDYEWVEDPDGGFARLVSPEPPESAQGTAYEVQYAALSAMERRNVSPPAQALSPE